MTKKSITPREQLAIAKRHLDRVQVAWPEPDWSDLLMYGLYALESAIVAAAGALGWDSKRTHPAKSELAERLHAEKGLPDVTGLLPMLNTGRKALAYGDEEFDVDELDPEDIATEIEAFVDAVSGLLSATDEDE